MHVAGIISCAVLAVFCQPDKPEPKKVPVATLITELDSKDADKRMGAAIDLGIRGEEAANALPKLLELVKKDPDAYVRQESVNALGSIARSDKKVIAAVLEALKKDVDSRVRASAASTLGLTDVEPKVAQAALIEALKDVHWMVRGNTVVSLERFRLDETARKALETTLEDKSAHVRVVAAAALLRNKPMNKAPFVVIVRAFQPDVELKEDDDKFGHIAATRFLTGIDAKQVGLVPVLIKALADDDAKVRYHAAYALQFIGPPASDAVPALKKALNDEEAQVRLRAQEALRKIEAGEKPPR